MSDRDVLSRVIIDMRRDGRLDITDQIASEVVPEVRSTIVLGMLQRAIASVLHNSQKYTSVTPEKAE